MKRILLGLAAVLFVFTACIKKDLEECPPVIPASGSTLAVNVFVERFQGTMPVRALANTEEKFNDRIQKLQYYLYLDDKVVEKGVIEGVKDITAPSYLFMRENLAPGNYKLAFLANTNEGIMKSVTDVLDEIIVIYPGYERTEDYFVEVFPFTITETKAHHEFDALLKRMQGVVRYNFKNLGPDIRAIEIKMDGLCWHGCINGRYMEDYEITRRVDISDITKAGERNTSFFMGTFPTMENRKSSWTLKLYTEDSYPYYDKMVTDTLQVVRNQLLDITAELNDAEIIFTVEVDKKWDGSSDGGSSEID